MSFVKSRYKINQQYLFPFLLATLPIFGVFFNEKAIPIIIIISVFTFFFEKNKSKNFAKNKLLLTPYIIYILVHIIYVLLSSNIDLGVKQLEKQISLLLIPCLFFIGDFNKDRLLFFIKTYLFLIGLISLFSFAKMIWFISFYSDWIQDTNNGNQNLIISYIQYKFPHLMSAHPTYWSYLLVLANIFLLSQKCFLNSYRKYIQFGLFIIFNVTLLCLFSRTVFVINFIIILLTSIKYTIKNRINFRVLVSIFVFLLIAVFSMNLPFIQSKFYNVFNDERFFLWPKSLEIIKNNYFILGEGLAQGNELLKSYIINTTDTRIYYHGYDLHNQYIKCYLDMGILGFLSLLYMLFFPLNKFNFFSSPFNFKTIGFVLLFLLSFLTESPLSVIKGIVIFSVFSSVVLLMNQISDFDNYQ